MAEVTDGKVLARVEGPYVGKKEDYPSVPALESASNGSSDTIVPAKEWKEAFKGVAKRAKPVLQSVAIVQGQDVSTLVSTDLQTVNVRQPRNVEGRWPATDEVFPSKPVMIKVRLNPELLAKLVKLASEYADEANSAIDMTIYSESQPVLVEAENGQGQKFRGLIMPLTK